MCPQVCEGYVFTGICLSTGGMHGSGGDHGRVACVWQGACMTGGMHGGGHVWQGVWWGHAWQGHVWQGACMAGGMHGMHTPGRYYEIQSMSWQYASYWNAFFSFQSVMNGVSRKGIPHSMLSDQI